MMEIKNRFTGAVIFSLEKKSLKLCVEAAVKNKTYLGGAYLRGADLCDADLGGAYLRDADLCDADLCDADLRSADLGGADLCDADLCDADLRGADLRGADLRDADLDGAKYGDDIPITIEPLQILGLQWTVFIFDHHMKIGCELHSFNDWEAFDDARINKMDTGALKFWRAHKGFLMTAARLHEEDDYD